MPVASAGPLIPGRQVHNEHNFEAGAVVSLEAAVAWFADPNWRIRREHDAPRVLQVHIGCRRGDSAIGNEWASKRSRPVAAERDCSAALVWSAAESSRR